MLAAVFHAHIFNYVTIFLGVSFLPVQEDDEMGTIATTSKTHQEWLDAAQRDHRQNLDTIEKEYQAEVSNAKSKTGHWFRRSLNTLTQQEVFFWH